MTNVCLNSVDGNPQDEYLHKIYMMGTLNLVTLLHKMNLFILFYLYSLLLEN